MNNHLSVLAVTKHEKQHSIRSPDRQVPGQIHPEFINFLDAMMGPYIRDIIAFVKTAHTKYFITWYYHPSSSGVSALAQQDCTFHNNFVNEPVRLTTGY